MMEKQNKEDFVEFAKKLAFGDSLVNVKGTKVEDRFIPTLHGWFDGLKRFLEAQNKSETYQKALEEVKSGKKITHWIWFIFPTLHRLESSETSRYYGLCGRNEAEEYINNPILRDRLIEITEAVYNSDKTVYEIFGNDAYNVRSCMLLFASISDEPIFKKMIQKYLWK